MLKRIIVFTLAVLFFLPAMALYGEIRSLDPDVNLKKNIPHTQEISRRTEVPGQNVMGYLFPWDASKSSYIEMAFSNPIKLPAFHAASVRAKIWAPEGCSAQLLSIRFRDKDGEVSQFRKKVSFKTGGFFDVEWKINPLDIIESWGPKTLNKKIDMPAELITMVVGYSTNISFGSLWLLDLKVECFSLAKKLEASRPLFLLDNSSTFRRVWKTSNFTVKNNTLIFHDTNTQLSDWERRFEIAERKFEITRYETPPVKLVFDTELLKGKTSLTAVFAYADAAVRKKDPQSFKLKSVVVKPGRNKTVLEIGDSMKEALHAVRLELIGLIPIGKEPLSLKIHGIDIVQSESAAEAVDFEILTDHKVPVLSVGGEDDLKFRFTNRANEDADLCVSMEYENYFGVKKNEQFDLDLKAGKRIDIKPKWRPDSLGHWRVKASIKNKNDNSMPIVKERSLSWINPAGPQHGRTSGFLFSVSTHTQQWSSLDRQLEIEAAALCGIKVVRVGGCGWNSLETKRGIWNWTLIDELVKNYGKKGIEAQVILCSTPSWAAPKEIFADKTKTPEKNFPADINDWKNYVRKVGEHFKGKIRFYEIWNEPDLRGFNEMSLDQYVALQKAAYDEMKKADPNAFVMTGGFATLSRHSGLIYPEFQRDYLLAAKDHFKIHAIHEHGWFDGYRQKIDELFFPLRKETNTVVPWYSNETAMTSVNGREKRQAQNLFKKMLFSWIRGAIGYTWYDLRDDGFDPVYGEHHFGMVTNDFYPKEVYSVYNMLTSYYTGMKAVKDWSQGKNICLYEFGNGTDLLFPGWMESRLDESHQMIIKTDAKSAKVIDIMGNETPVEIRNSLIVYEIGPVPQTLKLENCSFGELIGELLTVDQNKELVPGRKWIVSLTAANPLDRDLVFDLSLNNTGIYGLSTSDLSKKITVPALGKGSVSFDFDVDKNFDQSTLLTLNYDLKGTNWKGTFYIPVIPAMWIASSYKTAKPDFVLDKINLITPTTPADPSNAHRLWKDPSDLSAKVRLAGREDQLHINCEIEDDKDVPSNGYNIDQGDQIRFFFKSGGRSDFTEIALLKNEKGKTAVRLLQSDNKISKEDLEHTGKLNIQRKETKTIYEFSVPFGILGLSRDRLFEQGIRFDLLIGDDDGEGMDSWIHCTPKNPDRENIRKAPLLFFEK